MVTPAIAFARAVYADDDHDQGRLLDEYNECGKCWRLRTGSVQNADLNLPLDQGSTSSSNTSVNNIRSTSSDGLSHSAALTSSQLLAPAGFGTVRISPGSDPEQPAHSPCAIVTF